VDSVVFAIFQVCGGEKLEASGRVGMSEDLAGGLAEHIADRTLQVIEENECNNNIRINYHVFRWYQ
jgi:hypothetical protein